MSHSKNHYTPPGSDESLARLINYSDLWMSQGSDWEAMMRQEAFTTATQPLEKEKSNSGTLIRLEIVASLIFFLVVLLTIAVNNSNVVSAPLDTHKFEQHAQYWKILRRIANPIDQEGAFAKWEQAWKNQQTSWQLLGYHYANYSIPQLFGTPEQKAYFSSQSASHKWFWGDAVNPRDPDLILTPDGDNFRLNGVKKFCTGTKGSDVVVISGTRSDLGNILFAILPSYREGIVINDDWDYMGQRQTDSGSVVFDNVLIQKDEVMGEPNSKEPPHPYATMVTCLAQLVFVNLYLGIALGAFEEAKKYTLTTTRPWLFSPAAQAAQDPYIIEQYGNLWIDLTATASHADHVASLLQAAWDKGEQLTAAERGEVAVAIASAKVLSTRVALNVTSKIFEVMGARSAATKYRFERYWRNVRTHTLHDPVAYKVYEVGNWVLNEQIPIFTLYT